MRADPIRALESQDYLPVTLLSRYLFFLSRRPVSASNSHFLTRRLSGLKGLACLVERHDSALAADLRGLTPRNFGRRSGGLQARLGPLPEFPQGFLVSRGRPDPSFVGDVRQCLLVFGPGIGIGDEIIGFSLPHWLAQDDVSKRVSILSAYPGLWDSIEGPVQIHLYRDYAKLVEALRGGLGSFDLIVLVDFEKPGLLNALSFEPELRRYLEISLGGRYAAAMDCEARTIFHEQVPEPYLPNYYHSLCHLVRWLGLSPDLSGRPAIQRRGRASRRREEPPCLNLFVSPFTSKYEPRGRYWSELLGTLAGAADAPTLRIHVDPGPNADTERFAGDLMRSVRARLPSTTRCDLAGDDGKFGLAEVFELMATMDAVLCTDSFAAHAAPLCGCTTFVVATDGLERWRVPDAPSFYFGGSLPPRDVAGAMRWVLRELHGPQVVERHPVAASRSARRLDLAARELGNSIDGPLQPAAALISRYADCLQLLQVLLRDLESWPSELAPLLTDHAYQHLLPPLPTGAISGVSDPMESDLMTHLRSQLEELRNSNLLKLVGLARRCSSLGDEG